MRGSVIETMRMSKPNEWYWVSSNDNPCDIGTRREVSLEDVEPGSKWETGKPWMRESKEKFPLKTVEEIKLLKEKEIEFHAEFSKQKAEKGFCMFNDTIDSIYLDLAIKYETEQGLSDRMPANVYLTVNKISSEVGKRLYRLQYVIDPRRFSFSKLVRVLSFVRLFVRKMFEKWRRMKNYLNLHLRSTPVFTNLFPEQS